MNKILFFFLTFVTLSFPSYSLELDRQLSDLKKYKEGSVSDGGKNHFLRHFLKTRQDGYETRLDLPYESSVTLQKQDTIFSQTQIERVAFYEKYQLSYDKGFCYGLKNYRALYQKSSLTSKKWEEIIDQDNDCSTFSSKNNNFALLNDTKEKKISYKKGFCDFFYHISMSVVFVEKPLLKPVEKTIFAFEKQMKSSFNQNIQDMCSLTEIDFRQAQRDFRLKNK